MALFHHTGQEKGDPGEDGDEHCGQEHEKEKRQGGLGDLDEVVVIEGAEAREVADKIDLLFIYLKARTPEIELRGPCFVCY